MKGKIGAIVIGFFIVLGLIGAAMCATKVPAGYVGVVYNMNGGVEGQPLSQGFHFTSPTKKVTLYSVAIEQGYLSRDKQEGSRGDDSFDIPTSDGKTINVDMEYSYHFDASRITDTFVKFKGQDGNIIENTFIRGKLKAWAGEISSTYTVIDVFGDKRAELNMAVKNHVADKFYDYGIVIDSINFTRIETDGETAAAIQKKVNAQQELELAQIEAKTASVEAEKVKEVALIKSKQEKEMAEIEAQKMKIDAEAKAEAAKIAAQADATNILLKAEAEAKGNKLLSDSMTTNLINMEIAKNWNGVLPTISSNGSGMLLDVGNVLK